MRLRLLATAVATVFVATSASAEPPKAPVQNANVTNVQSAPVVVAAADEAPQVPAGDQQATPPAKPVRHARVTTCRCGDQNPSN